MTMMMMMNNTSVICYDASIHKYCVVYFVYCRVNELFALFVTCVDPEGRTGGPDPPPPWDLSEVVSCVEVWGAGEGVQRMFLSYFDNFFWLAPLASIIHTVNIWKIRITSKFKGLPLLPSYTVIPGFYESAISMFICLKLHDFTPFKPIFFWGRTPNPPPYKLTHFTKLRQSPWMCFACRKHHEMSYL